MSAAVNSAPTGVKGYSIEEILKQQSTLKVETATAADAEAIASVVNPAFSEGDYFRDPKNNRTSAESPWGIKADLLNAKNTWLVVVPKVGKREIVAVMLYTVDSATECSIHMLATDKKMKGLKLGTMLIDAGVARAKSAGMQKMTLEVVVQNPKLVKFYEAHGFIKTTSIVEFCADFPQALLPEYRGPTYEKEKIMCMKMERVFATAVATGAAAPATTAAAADAKVAK